jgi:hypothetical protein
MSTDMIDEPRETEEGCKYDVRIVVDDSAFQSALSDFKSYLSRKAIELPESLPQLVTIDLDRGVAQGTGEYRIVLKPSDSLLELVSAARLRTGDR